MGSFECLGGLGKVSALDQATDVIAIELICKLVLFIGTLVFPAALRQIHNDYCLSNLAIVDSKALIAISIPWSIKFTPRSDGKTAP